MIGSPIHLFIFEWFLKWLGHLGSLNSHFQKIQAKIILSLSAQLLVLLFMAATAKAAQLWSHTGLRNISYRDMQVDPGRRFVNQFWYGYHPDTLAGAVSAVPFVLCEALRDRKYQRSPRTPRSHEPPALQPCLGAAGLPLSVVLNLPRAAHPLLCCCWKQLFVRGEARDKGIPASWSRKKAACDVSRFIPAFSVEKHAAEVSLFW